MKGLTQKLLLSILTVVITTIALGTTTFAWFTVTNTARVQEFEAEVVGDSGIEISFDEIAWYTSMSKEVVEYYLFTNTNPNTGYQGANFRFDHVTSPNGVTINGLGDSQAGRYLDFTLYFRSPNLTNIYLTNLTLTSPELQSWTSNVDFILANGDDADAGSTYGGFQAANAARISFVGSGVAAPIVYENPSAGGNFVLGGHTNVAFAEEILDDGVGTGEYGPATDNPELFRGAVSYYVASTTEPPFGYGSVTVANTITNLNSVNDDNEDVIGLLVAVLTEDEDSGYNTGTVRIRVWLEGWDPDTYNSILDGKIGLSFTFKDEPDLVETP
ncbi:MAG: hypothetical protein WCY22_01065 [Acholeplasmataceae bacterium]